MTGLAAFPFHGPRPLVVRLRNWVGDVVLSVPTLQRLSAAGFDLHLVGKRWAQDLLGGFGWTVHALEPRHSDRVTQMRRLARQLRRSGGPAVPAVVFPYSFSSALEARLAGLESTGFAAEGRRWLLSHPVARPRGVHTAVEYARLGGAFLGSDLALDPQIGWQLSGTAQQGAEALIRQHGLAAGFVLACPFAGGPIAGQDRRWPAFGDYLHALSRLSSWPIVTCPGSAAEADQARAIGAGLRILDNVGMDVYGALMARAAVVVSNDTGPGHLAAAVGAPLVSVLGPTDPAQWGAWGPTASIVRYWPRWPTVAEVMDKTQPHLIRPRPAFP